MSMSEQEQTRAARVTTPNDREIRIERVFDAPRDRVWRAYTDRDLVARWWGRGNRLEIERLEVVQGGYWRFVEHSPEGSHGFGGRFREVTPPSRIVQTFEWDGMPGYVAVNTATFEDIGGGRTRLVTVSLFHTTEERDGMLNSGMEAGMSESYAALDALLAEGPEPAPKVTPFLMFNDQLEAAIELYTSVLPGSAITNVARAGADGPVISAEFVVGGQRFMAFNGGPHFSFSEGFSLYVPCADQREVDEYWDKLVAAGATPSQCGWITDPFGLSWQIVPRRFVELMGDADPRKVQAVVAAMMTMSKLDVAVLEQAHASA